jgi:hypothetical protein
MFSKKSEYIHFELKQETEISIYLIQKDKKITNRANYGRVNLILARVRNNSELEFYNLSHANARGGALTSLMDEDVFTILPPGRYVLRVRVWSSDLTTIPCCLCAYSQRTLQWTQSPREENGGFMQAYARHLFLINEQKGNIEKFQNGLCKWFIGYDQMYLIWYVVNGYNETWKVTAEFDVFDKLKWSKPYKPYQRKIELVLKPGESRLIMAKEEDSTIGSSYHYSWGCEWGVGEVGDTSMQAMVGLTKKAASYRTL